MLYKGGSSSLALCHLEMNIKYITLLLSLKEEYAVKDLVYALEGETLSLYLSMFWSYLCCIICTQSFKNFTD